MLPLSAPSVKVAVFPAVGGPVEPSSVTTWVVEAEPAESVSVTVQAEPAGRSPKTFSSPSPRVKARSAAGTTSVPLNVHEAVKSKVSV